jgi:hypothetical protein
LKPQLTVAISGDGSGTVTGPGINCDPSNTPCHARYDPGTSVTLTASESSGSTFGGWIGCTSVLLNECTVVMTADQSVMATFTDLPAPP